MMIKLSLLFMLAIILNFGSAVYFELNGGQTKCFIEENPKDTTVLGKYILEDITPQQGGYGNQLSLTVKVTDPEKREVLSKTMPSNGRFAFSTQVGGEHKICFSTNTSKWFGPSVKTRLHLEIEGGAGANDYEEIAKVEHLTGIEISLRRLNDRVNQIRKEQSYQKGREIVFRNTSESTNARVMWWSIIQLVVLVLTGVWQMKHLKSFFKAKKLV
ncbi:hypothetical protein ACTFIZ_007276 [Dictyostelium cf. discoideum]